MSIYSWVQSVGTVTEVQGKDPVKGPAGFSLLSQKTLEGLSNWSLFGISLPRKIPVERDPLRSLKFKDPTGTLLNISENAEIHCFYRILHF